MKFVRILAWSALTAVACSGLTACNSGKPAAATATAPKPDAAWSEHLAEHTAGTVSRRATITLRFSHDIATEGQFGQSAAAVLSISPDPTGTPRFAGRREIEWTPVEPLFVGKEYRATLKANGLSDVPKTLPPYEFAFRAITPDFEVRDASLKPEPEVRNQLVLTGRLETADGENADKVEKLLDAKLGDKALPLTWSHVDNNKVHHFTATGVTRGDTATLLRLTWDGKPLGIAREGVRELEVPALGSFAVLDAQTLTEGRQTLRVRFTDTLDKRQKLEPLVTLTSGSKKPKATMQVDGSDLLIYPTEHLSGEVEVTVAGGLLAAGNRKLGTPYTAKLSFPNERPQVRYTGKGTILPAGPALSIPFEAINVQSVRVTAFQIYENDIGSFLQANTLSGNTDLHRVGRYLWRKTITLPPGEPNRWIRHALDAGDLLRAHPGALFRLTLSITRADSTYSCPGEAPPASDEPLVNHDDLDLTSASGWDGIDAYY